MSNKALNIMIPEKMYNELKKEAEKKSISLAALARIVFSEHLDKK
ncbi:hypothetical protein [Paenibacillus peoriae]|nr:hypothetical protein [Paenibacillus peoriae]